MSEAGDAVRVDFVVLVLEVGGDGKVFDTSWVLDAHHVLILSKECCKPQMVQYWVYQTRQEVQPIVVIILQIQYFLMPELL